MEEIRRKSMIKTTNFASVINLGHELERADQAKIDKQEKIQSNLLILRQKCYSEIMKPYFS